MGRHSLKGRMPRTFTDQRCAEAHRLRVVYTDLMEKVPNPTGRARRMALLAAQSWIAYEDLSIKLDRFIRGKRSALESPQGATHRGRPPSCRPAGAGGYGSRERATGAQCEGSPEPPDPWR